ncbi:clp1-like protein [Schizophyllum fasciatum]
MHHSSPTSSYPSASLPRTLQRPQFHEVSTRTMAAIAPDLAGVPIEYVKRQVVSAARQMMTGTAALTIPSTMRQSHLPAQLNVGCRPTTGAAYPTHLLAIGPSKLTSADQTLILVPTHALVFATHCPRAPALDASAPSPSGNALPLHVVRMSVPSPAAFSILHAYMYTHRSDAVMQALLPSLPASAIGPLRTREAILGALGSGQTKHQLAVNIAYAEAYNLSRLSAYAAHVKEVWQDMVSLGMCDAQLWDTIDLCWEIVLASLNLAIARR